MEAVTHGLLLPASRLTLIRIRLSCTIAGSRKTNFCVCDTDEYNRYVLCLMLSTQVQQTRLYNTHLLHIPVMSLGHTICRYKALFAYGKTKKIRIFKKKIKGVGRRRSARRSASKGRRSASKGRGRAIVSQTSTKTVSCGASHASAVKPILN